MRLGGWPYPVVVDLAGMKVTRKARPILKDHDRGSIVGHTDDIVVGENRLEVAGVISGVGSTAQEVIATSENGFPWQASLGANADKVVFIPEGKTPMRIVASSKVLSTSLASRPLVKFRLLLWVPTTTPRLESLPTKPSMSTTSTTTIPMMT